MSLPSLLFLASLVAALVFFLAGFLLAPRRSAKVPPSSAGGTQLEAPTERVAVAAGDVSAAAGNQTEEPRAGAEKEAEELRRARAECARLAELEKTAAERLRVAEEANRAAFEREEKAAEAWAAQLEVTKAERKRHEQSLARELDDLRAQVALHVQGEQQEQQRAAASEAERRRLQSEVEEVRSREQQALARLAELEVASRARLAELEAEARAKLDGAEAALRARLDEVEAATQARLAEAEAEAAARTARATAGGDAKAAAALDELRARLASAEEDRSKVAQELERAESSRKAAEEGRQEFELRMRAAEEVVEILRGELAAVKEALRSAQGGLKDRERLAKENAELREQQAMAQHDAKEHVAREDEVKDVRVELVAAQSKLAELASTTEENRRLRDEIAELRGHQDASAELERLTAAHKQVRLDAELMARRLQELLHDQAELAPLRAQAAEAATLAQEVEYLRRREKDLEAQLYASGSYASREMPRLTGELHVVAPVTDLETNLTELVGQGGPRTAVLADGQGFLIASAGESVAEEGLAAFAAMAGDMVGRARQLLPLADVDSVRVTDANRMVLTCHLFTSAGEPMGLATLGPGEPPADKTARAIAGLTAIVAGSESDGETPKPTT